MSNRARRDGAIVEIHEGNEGGPWQDDVDGMLGHVGQQHRYAERVVDMTPDSVEAFYNQRVWKDGTDVYNAVSGVANVFLGKVEPGTFWIIENLNIANGLAASVGFAYIMEGVGVTTFARRARVTMDAGGAYGQFDPPIFIGNGDVFIRCVQTTPAADSVIVTAQVRIVAKS
jgi:hypothetical protein